VGRCAVKVLKRDLRHVRDVQYNGEGITYQRVGKVGEMALPCRASVG